MYFGYTRSDAALARLNVHIRCQQHLANPEVHTQDARRGFWSAAPTVDAPNAEHSAPYASTLAELCSIAPPPGYVNVCGVMLPRRTALTPPIAAAFVETPATRLALHSAALACAAAAPILLSGPPGSGKSSLACSLAAATGNTDMLQLFCDDLMDARALLGAYVCAATPGEFSWQPGPLAQAVAEGRWVLLDSLHLAPVEVVAQLEAFVATGALHVAARSESIQPHANFRLLATVQPSPTAEGAFGGLSAAGVAEHWWQIDLPPPQLVDRVAVLSGMFPAAQHLVLPVMALAEVVRAAQSRERGHEDPDAPTQPAWRAWLAAVQSCMADCGLAQGSCMIALGRELGTHDLVKVLRRITTLHGDCLAKGLAAPPDGGALTPGGWHLVSHELRAALLAEACEALCGSAASRVRVPRQYCHWLYIRPEPRTGAARESVRRRDVSQLACKAWARSDAIAKILTPLVRGAHAPLNTTMLPDLSAARARLIVQNTTHCDEHRHLRHLPHKISMTMPRCRTRTRRS